MPTEVSPFLLLPFVALLTLVALAPFFFADWWGKHYAKVACGLAALVVAYYCFGLHASATVLRTGHDYLSFIALIGSLFIVSGGIHIQVKGEATPHANVVFLLIGALAANVLGTTGASMLLIRPWLRMNKYRLTGHHVVFFIFLVSNVGGCLTPIGDPPLFLGYLMGVPFTWVIVRCLPMWLTGVGLLLAMFYWVDRRNYTRAPRAVRDQFTTEPEHWKFEGLANLGFLALVLGAVFINRPPFLRESLMVAAALGSYFTTHQSVHEANHFNLNPIKEVALLFIGIFGTMLPALDWLQLNASRLNAATPGFFYWGSGSLSSVLDNAPTYLCFLKASFGRFLTPELVTQINHVLQSHANLAALTGPHAEEIRQTVAALQKYHPADLVAGCVNADQIQVAYLLGNRSFSAFITAVSVGAVFFGANTYIGNGPNFMVKAIADHQKAHTPTFLGYIFKYTLPYMLPMLLIVWLLYFRQ